MSQHAALLVVEALGHVPFQVFLHPLDLLVQRLDLLLEQGIIIGRVIDVLPVIGLGVIGLLLLLILVGMTLLVIFRV